MSDLTDAFREQMPRLLDLHSQPSAFHACEMERAKERGRQWKVDEMARAVREYVDRELADAPPGSVVEIVATSNTHAGAVRIGAYTFEQTGS